MINERRHELQFHNELDLVVCKKCGREFRSCDKEIMEHSLCVPQSTIEYAESVDLSGVKHVYCVGVRR